MLLQDPDWYPPGLTEAAVRAYAATHSVSLSEAAYRVRRRCILEEVNRCTTVEELRRVITFMLYTEGYGL